MSNVSLGLSDKQIAYLTFFTKPDQLKVSKPREQVYHKQREHLTKGQSLLTTLQSAYQTLQKATQSFSIDFRKFRKDEVKARIADVDQWTSQHKNFEREINESRAVFVPRDLLDQQSKLSTMLRQLQSYAAQAKEFLELCDIEEQIVFRYRQDKRDYNAIERLYDRYLKLSLTAQGWILPDCNDKLNELKGEVESLHRFNKSMEALTKEYQAFAQSYKTKTARFKVKDQLQIRKDMGSFAAWVSNYKKLQSWVMALPEAKRDALIGDHNTTATNKNHAYRTYGDFAEYLKGLLDDSDSFYAACKFCSDVEQMSKMVNTKKPEVEKLIGRYEALNQSVKRFVEESYVTLLYSLRESSDVCARLQESLAKLDSLYVTLPNNVKNLSYTYTYDTFAVVQGNAEKAQAWLDNYEVVHSWAAAQSGKAVYFRTPALAQKAKDQASNAERLKTYIKWFENVKTAHAFESGLIELKSVLRSNAKLCSDKKAEYRKLIPDVQKLVSSQWIDFLNQSEKFHNQKASLEAKIKRQAATIANIWKVLPELDYTTFNTATANKQQLVQWLCDLDVLSNELQDFEYEYKEEILSADQLFSEKQKARKYLSDYETLSKNHGFFRWSETFASDLNTSNMNEERYPLDMLNNQLESYRTRKAELSKFDGKGKMASNFDAVAARIQQIYDDAAYERMMAAKRKRSRRIKWLIFELIALGAYVVTLLLAAGKIPVELGFVGSVLVRLVLPVAVAITNMLVHRAAFKSCVPIVLFDVLSVILAVVFLDIFTVLACVLSLISSYIVIYIYAKQRTKERMRRAIPICISIFLVLLTILVLLTRAVFPAYILWLFVSAVLIVITFLVMFFTAKSTVGKVLAFVYVALSVIYILLFGELLKYLLILAVVIVGIVIVLAIGIGIIAALFKSRSY